MDTTTPTTVVVEERRHRRGLVWVAGGAALLLGGSTFALWSASDTFAGGTITAGDLNVDAGTSAWYDTSADRQDAVAIADVGGTAVDLTGHAITDPGTWRMVPGDEATLALPFTATLQGDNLVAALAFDRAGGAPITSTFAEAGLTGQVTVYDAGGAVVFDEALEDLAAADGVVGYLAAPRRGRRPAPRTRRTWCTR